MGMPSILFIYNILQSKSYPLEDWALFCFKLIMYKLNKKGRLTWFFLIICAYLFLQGSMYSFSWGSEGPSLGVTGELSPVKVGED